MRHLVLPPTLILLAALLAALHAANATSFPPLTDAARQITTLSEYPDATAVVLRKTAELRIKAPGSRESSILDIAVRVKILRPEGVRDWGQVSVAHGAGVRLDGFDGRTVLPDGSVLPLAEDSVFTEERSRVRERYVTKAAFPGVAPGSIVDYRFTLRWDSIYFLEPWTFDHPIPTLRAELTYHEPLGMTLEHWSRTADGIPLQSRSQRTLVGRQITLWREDLPPVLDEPFAPPLSERSSFVVVVPRSTTDARGEEIPLMASWADVCRAFENGSYAAARAKRRATRKQARGLIDGLRTTREKIETLHAFVRDEIASTGAGGVSVASGTTVDGVLDNKRGGSAAQALLLQALLDASKIPSRLVWAVDWRDGDPPLDVPNPGWFERVLVRVEAADAGSDTPLYLDPEDRRLAAGNLSPTLEGSSAILVDGARPETLRLPSTPAAESYRHAVLDLAIAEDGRLLGSGTLELTGNHAWIYLRRRDNPAEVRDGWRRWLEDALPGFEIADVEVAESIANRRVEVAWNLEQRAADVLGDEVAWRPSRPLGPLRQRYTEPTARRRVPVQVSFADRDEIELRLTWPPGWVLDLLPADVEIANRAGVARATFEVDDTARRLTYHRVFEITATRFAPGEDYAALRELYGTMESSDAQELVWINENQ